MTASAVADGTLSCVRTPNTLPPRKAGEWTPEHSERVFLNPVRLFGRIAIRGMSFCLGALVFVFLVGRAVARLVYGP